MMNAHNAWKEDTSINVHGKKKKKKSTIHQGGFLGV
jgi:hypothetical protein